jgi:hypothetical protein
MPGGVEGFVCALEAEATTKDTKHTKKNFLNGNTPRGSSISPRWLFPLKLQFFVSFVRFVVNSPADK